MPALSALVRAVRTAVATVLAAASIGGASASRAAADETVATTVPALIVTSISVPQGTLRVSLPSDVAAGDTISGTVVAEPAGRSDAERRANAATLDGYVVEAGATKTRAAQRAIVFLVPPAATTATILVRRSSGEIAGRTDVPVRVQQAAPLRQAAPSDFRFPQHAAAGQPFRISGPFSGNVATVSLTVGGRPAEVIAESPRMLVAAPPAAFAGPGRMRLSESGVSSAAPCRVVSLTLSAPSTRITKGAHVPVHIVVGGLEGLQETLRVRLVNATPDVVALAGGDAQVLRIRPDEVAAGGQHAQERDLAGLRAGSFSLSATLDEPVPQIQGSAPVPP